ncbi:MAG: YdcF family protein [Gammaproteobacteria bacterium]
MFESEILIKAAQRGIYSNAVAIPAVYTEQARPSHFRGVRDITGITLMVARSLIVRGFYLQGLYRAVIKPRLLPAHNGHVDYAGYFTATLSLFVMLLSGGLTLLLAIVHTWRTAKRAATVANGQHVVVLGKRLRNNVPDHEYRLRLDRAAALYRMDNTREFYLLGGTTGEAEISESLAGQQYLEAQGIPPSQLHIEQDSRNTLENIRHLRERVDIPDQRIVLISNRYHLARARIMARRFGFQIETCAAEQDTATGLMDKWMYVVEALLLHWFLTGLSYARLTRNQAMLLRISR